MVLPTQDLVVVRVWACLFFILVFPVWSLGVQAELGAIGMAEGTLVGQD